MTRLAWILVAVLAAPALAGTNHRAEAIQVLEAFLSGRMGSNAAANRLSYLGEALYASDELVASWRRADPKLQAQILECLVALGVATEDTERLFLRALDMDDVTQVVVGARGLARLKSPKGRAKLETALGAKQTVVRREAARALGEIGVAKSGAPLLAAAKKEEDLDARVVMVVAVGKTGDKKQVPGLEALLAGDSESTRAAAAQALCLLGAKSGVQYASKLLTSAQPLERLQGVLLFEGASAKVAGPPLKVALDDKDHKVRATAARVLVQGGDKTKVEWLVLESAKAISEDRLAYEDQIEKLRLSDEARTEILKKAGLK
jgi:HEAT repeat protein